MRILFVDDESSKLKRLYAILSTLEGINKGDIEHVLDLKSAKEKMSILEYDLVIMDLNISEYIGNEDLGDCDLAGLNFIDEIIEIDSVKTPREILILTEHEALRQKCIEMGRNFDFQVLKYDESIEWENIIKSKVKYFIKYEESQKRFSDFDKCDVAIISAVDVEMDAIRRAFDEEKFTLKNFENDSTNYYVFDETSKEIKRRIVAVQQSEMGMAGASNITNNVIYHFRPKYIIMVGIAAGIGGDKNFGDIIIATEVWNYSSGKYLSGKEDNIIEFSPDPKSISLASPVERKINLNHDSILYRIRKKWTSKVENDLKIIKGPLACGAAVVGNSKIVDEMIKKHSRKTVGLDMESYGMFYTAEYGINNNTIPICIKSISDFADAEKGDGYQRYAAFTSVEFTKYLIQEVLEF